MLGAVIENMQILQQQQASTKWREPVANFSVGCSMLSFVAKLEVLEQRPACQECTIILAVKTLLRLLVFAEV
jgi:hypothetical protein